MAAGILCRNGAICGSLRWKDATSPTALLQGGEKSKLYILAPYWPERIAAQARRGLPRKGARRGLGGARRRSPAW